MTPRQIVEDIYNLVRKCEETDWRACYNALASIAGAGCKMILQGADPLKNLIFETGVAYSAFTAIADYAVISEHIGFNASEYERLLRLLEAHELRRVKLEDAYRKWRDDFTAFYTSNLGRGRYSE